MRTRAVPLLVLLISVDCLYEPERFFTKFHTLMLVVKIERYEARPCSGGRGHAKVKRTGLQETRLVYKATLNFRTTEHA